MFEPLEVDESAGDGDDVATQALAQPEDNNRWSSRIVLAGVVLAMLAAAGATAIVLLQPAPPAQRIVTPTDSTPLSTSGVDSDVANDVTDGVDHETCSRFTGHGQYIRHPDIGRDPTIQPQQPPTTIASQPPRTMPPPRNNDQRGGLLGGLP